MTNNKTETVCPDPKCAAPACCLRFCDGASYEPASDPEADGYDEWSDPIYVLGSVHAQVENLTPAHRIRVLREALASEERSASVGDFTGHPPASLPGLDNCKHGSPRGTCERCDKPARNVLGAETSDANGSIELPSPCGCGTCGECRNAGVMYGAIGRGWEDWSDEQIRGALAALELLGRVVARDGKPAPAYVTEHLGASDGDDGLGYY